MDLTGKTAGGCLIQKELGRGGLAAVYRAWYPARKCRVAFKILLEEYSQDSSVMKSFHQEAHILAQLNHPNIVRTYATGIHKGLPFIIMELLSGKTLDERLLDGKPMSVSDAMAIMKQVAGTVDYIHEVGIIHCDLKPDNVFVGSAPNFRVKLFDFNSARYMNPGNDGNLDPFGTRGYAAPEQYENKRLDARTDIYALGVLLFTMLAGRLPSGDPWHLKPEPLAQMVREVPGTFDVVIKTAFSFEQRQRFTSARQMMLMLRTAELVAKTLDERWANTVMRTLVRLTVKLAGRDGTKPGIN